MAVVTVTGGTGYIGRALIAQLVAEGHTVTALVRPQSRAKVPAGATIVDGSPLDSRDVAGALTPGCTLILLVGTPHPSPSKAAQFQDVDLASARAAAEALQEVAVAHVIYVSVAHPAPVMQAYIAVRREGERLLKQTRVPVTVLRPWYVLGPGHWWPIVLIPIYKLFEMIPTARDTAQRLGLVTHRQMVAALAAAVTASTPSPFRVLDVTAIRAVRP